MLSSSKSAEQLTLAEAVELFAYGANCDRCHDTRRRRGASSTDVMSAHWK